MVRKVLFTGLILLLATILQAQFAEDAANLLDNTRGFGARATAMGTAYTGVADDYSAIYWNPAGLAQIRRMEFYAGLSHLSFDNAATYNGTLTNGGKNFTKLSSLGMVFPVPTYRGSLVFALGYQRVKDFDRVLDFKGFSAAGNDLFFEFDDGQGGTDTLFFDKNVNRSETASEEGSLNNWSIAGAMDISPNVSVGVSLNIWTGSSSYLFDFLQRDLNENYPPSAFPGDFNRYLLSQKIIGDYSAFQFKIGAMLRPVPSVRLGVNIVLPSTFNVVENFNQTDELEFDNGELIELIKTDGEASEFEYDISTPFQFSFGASYTLADLVVSGGIEYIDYSQLRFELPENRSLGSEYDDLLDENSRIERMYEEQLKWKIGAEYTIRPLNLALRGGYFVEPSPLVKAPAEYDREFITGGVGVMIDKQFLLDLAYLYGTWKNASSDIYTPTLTTEEITYRKIFLTASFRF